MPPRAAIDVKAEDVKMLDMHELVTYTDFMVLCTGQNTRLTRRIAEEVAYKVKTGAGVLPVGTEGDTGGEWILLDFLDFVVHVFTPQSQGVLPAGRAVEAGSGRRDRVVGRALVSRAARRS